MDLVETATHWPGLMKQFQALGATLDEARARQFSRGLSSTRRQHDGASQLTKRQLEILQLVALGLPNRDIAKRLRLSDHTVKRHVANLLTKLGLASRAAAVAYGGTRRAALVFVRDESPWPKWATSIAVVPWLLRAKHARAGGSIFNRNPTGTPMTTRTEQLASRLEQGAKALGEFAEGLSDAQWRTKLPGDGRSVGVVVHHVATVYPIEVDLARTVASGKPIVGITYEDAIKKMNAGHATENANATKKDTLELLRRNSAGAAAAVRAFTDAELDRAAAVSLNADAPLTAQFVLEDHAVRHSYHHLAKIRAAV